MKTILSFITISLFLSLSCQAQEIKSFKIKEEGNYVSVLPKIDTVPSDFINQSYQVKKSTPYISEVVKNVTKRCLSPELAQKIIGKRVPVTLLFNSAGEVFYFQFIYPKELKPFIREDDLLKLYQGYRAIRFDMSRIDTTPMNGYEYLGEFKYGTWGFNLGKLAELVVLQPDVE